jgi:lysophospholipase L1-like esterase
MSLNKKELSQTAMASRISPRCCLILTLSLCLLGCLTPSAETAQTNNGPSADPAKPLPKVLLVGDSITGYYTPDVQRQLTNVAQASRLFRSTSRNFLTNLDEVIAAKPDVLHLNCGLWDMIILTNTGKPQVSLDEYKSNLGKIFERLRQETHATLIWSTTTPVNEEQEIKPKPHGYGRIVRRNSDIKTYNRASLEIAKQFGLECDDLFEVVTEAGPVEYLDGVHFKPPGNELLGKRVASVVLADLNKPR